MKPIDIGPAALKTVRRILRDRVPGIEVRAFGSRVSWTARETSDIDLALMTERPLEAARLASLRAAFTDSDLPFRVDVMDWASLSETFRRVIEREHVVLVEVNQYGSRCGWREETFGECARLIRDSAYPEACEESRYIGLEHIGARSLSLLGHGKASDVESVKSRFRCGDILFGKLRPYFRKVVRARFDGICSTDIWVVRPQHGILAGYLFYVMASQKFIDFATLGAEGTRMPRAQWSHTSRFRMQVPPLSEQRAIAHVLGVLDDRIAVNRRMNETLEAMAQTLFQDWFIDFGPTRAKAKHQTPYLPLPLWNLFPNKLTNSKLGKIPEGWKVKTLGQCYNLTMGQSPPGHTYNEQGSGLPFFQGRTDFGFRFPGRRKFCSSPARIAYSGDTLVSVRAPVGDVNMAWEKCCIGRGVAAVRHKSLSSSFTYYSIRSIQRSIREYEHTGTVFGAINKKQFEALMILEPSDEVVRQFDAYSRSIDMNIKCRTAESYVLTTLRNTLLPKLISENIRIHKTTRQTEDAA